MSAVRVAVVDDHLMVRDGLSTMLSLDERLAVVGTAGSIGEARALLSTWQPSVLVVDDQLPDGSGSELAAEAIEQLDDCFALIISGAGRPAAIDDAIDAGCSGFLSKGLGTEELADAVVAVANGGSVFPATALRGLQPGGPDRLPVPLTDRETEVLGLLADMYAPAEIGDELGISLHTVRNHIRSILSKLQARSQLEAVMVGLRRGLIELSRHHEVPSR